MERGDLTSGRGRSAVIAAVVLVLAGVVFLFQGEYRARTEVLEAVESGDGRLTLTIKTCDGDPQVEQMDEGADEVRIDVRSTHYLWGSDECLDQLDVQLDEPLGERELVDVETGDVVAVSQEG